MERIDAIFFIVFITASCLVVSLPVKASFRTIVVPDDFPTIQEAIYNASAGDTILVREGTYDEGKSIEINKTLTLKGEDANNTIVKLHPPVYNETHILTATFGALSNAITINANDFTLANLTIILSPDGYIVANGDRIHITDNNITGGTVTGLLTTGSHCNVTDNTSGGFISSNGFANLLRGNTAYRISVRGESSTVANNTVFYIHLSNNNDSVFYENRIGLATFYYYGIPELGREDSGIYIESNCYHNIFYSNEVAAFIYDVEINAKSENNEFYHNNFLKFYSGGASKTSGFANFWDNGSEGNYWADYNGTDANGDGIGDKPYILDGNNRDNYPLMFPFDIQNNAKVLPPPEPFSTLPVLIVVVAGVVVAVAGLLFYLKKRKR